MRSDIDADDELLGEGAEKNCDSEDLIEEVKPRRRSLRNVLVFVILPMLVMLTGAAAGYFKYHDDSSRNAATWRAQSTQAAKDATVALLSYRPDTVETDLAAAQNLLTGAFKESYAALTRDVVIPGAKERKISTAVSIPTTASISVSAREAQVLVFVNQTTIVGSDAPSDSASTVKVTMRHEGAKWLISDFKPI